MLKIIIHILMHITIILTGITLSIGQSINGSTAINNCQITAVITKSDNNKNIMVRPGDLVQIELKVQGGTGYTWDIEKMNVDCFEIIKVESKYDVDEGAAGRPVTKIWKLKIRNKCDTPIKFILYRIWEGKEKAIDNFQIKFSVS